MATPCQTLMLAPLLFLHFTFSLLLFLLHHISLCHFPCAMSFSAISFIALSPFCYFPLCHPLSICPSVIFPFPPLLFSHFPFCCSHFIIFPSAASHVLCPSLPFPSLPFPFRRFAFRHFDSRICLIRHFPSAPLEKTFIPKRIIGLSLTLDSLYIVILKTLYLNLFDAR
jgi:hypothetical protein